MEFTFKSNIEEADVTISFDYQPEEPCVPYYRDGTGYPGCAASIDGYEVSFTTKRFNSKTLKWEDVQINVTDFVQDMGYDIDKMCHDYIETLGE